MIILYVCVCVSACVCVCVWLLWDDKQRMIHEKQWEAALKDQLLDRANTHTHTHTAHLPIIQNNAVENSPCFSS